MKSRQVTNQILVAVEEGTLDRDTLIRDLLMWMPESDVADFANRSGLFEEEEDIDDSMDGDHDSAMASAGFGTDEDYGYYGPED